MILLMPCWQLKGCGGTVWGRGEKLGQFWCEVDGQAGSRGLVKGYLFCVVCWCVVVAYDLYRFSSVWHEPGSGVSKLFSKPVTE